MSRTRPISAELPLRAMRLRPHRAGRGFTLIELMVTLSIGVILMVVAVPSFVQFRRNSELADAANSFIMAANAAKSASLKSGRNTIMTVKNTTLGWRSGWTVFRDNNFDNAYDAGDELVMDRAEVSPDITVTAAGDTLPSGYILFAGNGFPRTTAGVPIAVTPASTLTMAVTGRTTRITLGTDGRLRSCRVGVDAGC